MSEKSIIFSPPMVKAFLADTKTQTRRVVFGKQARRPGYDAGTWDASGYDCITTNGRIVRVPWTTATIEQQITSRYQVGDRLWVKETWIDNWGAGIIYRADYAPDSFEHGAKGWQSPYVMPKSAARIWLEVVSKRAERLQDISEADAQTEGVELLPCTYIGRCQSNSCPRHGRLDRYRLAYQSLWDTLNAARGYDWASNPWVWVYGLKAAQP